jgi:hypothetical protein
MGSKRIKPARTANAVAEELDLNLDLARPGPWGCGKRKTKKGNAIMKAKSRWLQGTNYN